MRKRYESLAEKYEETTEKLIQRLENAEYQIVYLQSKRLPERVKYQEEQINQLRSELDRWNKWWYTRYT